MGRAGCGIKDTVWCGNRGTVGSVCKGTIWCDPDLKKTFFVNSKILGIQIWRGKTRKVRQI